MKVKVQFTKICGMQQKQGLEGHLWHRKPYTWRKRPVINDRSLYPWKLEKEEQSKHERFNNLWEEINEITRNHWEKSTKTKKLGFEKIKFRNVYTCWEKKKTEMINMRNERENENVNTFDKIQNPLTTAPLEQRGASSSWERPSTKNLQLTSHLKVRN